MDLTSNIGSGGESDSDFIASEGESETDEDPLLHGHEAAEQRRQELDQSLEPEGTRPNFPLELGLHLLDFHGCDEGSHEGVYEEHLVASAYPDSHYSLETLTRITSRLPNVIAKPKLINPRTPPVAENVD